jgi:hypothetical protein
VSAGTAALGSEACPARVNRSTTSRSWAAMTAVASSAGPSRTASSSATQEVRPDSSAETNKKSSHLVSLWLQMRVQAMLVKARKCSALRS